MVRPRLLRRVVAQSYLAILLLVLLVPAQARAQGPPYVDSTAVKKVTFRNQVPDDPKAKNGLAQFELGFASGGMRLLDLNLSDVQAVLKSLQLSPGGSASVIAPPDAASLAAFSIDVGAATLDTTKLLKRLQGEKFFLTYITGGAVPPLSASTGGATSPATTTPGTTSPGTTNPGTTTPVPAPVASAVAFVQGQATYVAVASRREEVTLVGVTPTTINVLRLAAKPDANKKQESSESKKTSTSPSPQQQSPAASPASPSNPPPEQKVEEAPDAYVEILRSNIQLIELPAAFATELREAGKVARAQGNARSIALAFPPMPTSTPTASFTLPDVVKWTVRYRLDLSNSTGPKLTALATLTNPSPFDIPAAKAMLSDGIYTLGLTTSATLPHEQTTVVEVALSAGAVSAAISGVALAMPAPKSDNPKPAADDQDGGSGDGQGADDVTDPAASGAADKKDGDGPAWALIKAPPKLTAYRYVELTVEPGKLLPGGQITVTLDGQVIGTGYLPATTSATKGSQTIALGPATDVKATLAKPTLKPSGVSTIDQATMKFDAVTDLTYTISAPGIAPGDLRLWPLYTISDPDATTGARKLDTLPGKKPVVTPLCAGQGTSPQSVVAWSDICPSDRPKPTIRIADTGGADEADLLRDLGGKQLAELHDKKYSDTCLTAFGDAEQALDVDAGSVREAGDLQCQIEASMRCLRKRLSATPSAPDAELRQIVGVLDRRVRRLADALKKAENLTGQAFTEIFAGRCDGPGVDDAVNHLDSKASRAKLASAILLSMVIEVEDLKGIAETDPIPRDELRWQLNLADWLSSGLNGLSQNMVRESAAVQTSFTPIAEPARQARFRMNVIRQVGGYAKAADAAAAKAKDLQTEIDDLTQRLAALKTSPLPQPDYVKNHLLRELARKQQDRRGWLVDQANFDDQRARFLEGIRPPNDPPVMAQDNPAASSGQ